MRNTMTMATRGRTAEEMAEKVVGIYKILRAGMPDEVIYNEKRDQLISLAAQFMTLDEEFLKPVGTIATTKRILQ